MEIEDNKYYKLFIKHKKIISLVEGICIILLLLGLWITYFHSNELQKKISENCGWAEENYECYCQKSDAIAMKNELIGKGININIDGNYGIH